MNKSLIFNFNADVSNIEKPLVFNNPFELFIPEIAILAAKEFQQFISLESENWGHDFDTKRGKMFGVLVVQKPDGEFGYLGTISGRIPENGVCNDFVPSVFDDAKDDFFLDRGMIELSEIGNEIKKIKDQVEINLLIEKRKQKSFVLQQQLFESYLFLNKSGEEKNVFDIFKNSSHGNPPVAAGECTAPKLLNYAFVNGLKPIALAEFWWGKGCNSSNKKHQSFYPACKNKCRTILEYMLDDYGLFNAAINNPENKKGSKNV